METINLQVLEDGTITLKTTAIGDSAHLSADNLMADFEALLGGKVEVKENPDEHRLAHLHKHAHIHKKALAK